MDDNTNYLLAKHLCDISHRSLWLPRVSWARNRKTNVNLVFRVGTGKATNHRAKGSLHTITFGQGMIESKRQSAAMSAGWTTGNEILKRNYFGGKLGLPELLVHTACHEFAHFIQVIMGRRYNGSVHNDEFYAILDKMHFNGHASKLLEVFIDLCRQDHLDLGFIEHSKPQAFKVSDTVFFNDKSGVQHSGKVVKINNKTVLVVFSYKDRTHQARISKSLCQLSVC